MGDAEWGRGGASGWSLDGVAVGLRGAPLSTCSGVLLVVPHSTRILSVNRLLHQSPPYPLEMETATSL